MPVHVNDRLLEELLGLFRPHIQPRLMDRLLQFPNLTRRDESPAEVAFRRGVGNALRSQRVQKRFIIATQLNILKTSTLAQRIVSEVQHVVRLVVGKMNLQQMQPSVDGFGQTDLSNQLVYQPDAPVADGSRTIRQLVLNVAGGKHRLREALLDRPIQPSVNAPLASFDHFWNNHLKSSVFAGDWYSP